MAYNLSIGNNLKYVVKESLREYSKKESVIAHTQKAKDIKFKEEYQGKIIDCMVGEVDDNYIETPETDAPIVKLENSREGLVKVPSIKGKTILVDAEGNETDTPGEGCRLVSVGEEGKLTFVSRNKNLFDKSKAIMGVYWSSNNTHISNPESMLSEEYIKVRNGEKYISKLPKGSMQVMEYDINFNFIQRLNHTTQSVYTVKENVGYIRLSFYQPGLDFNPMFEMGTVTTSYVEPQSHKAEIILDEPLRSLPNGVCDEQVGDKLIRRVGSIVLDGYNDITWWYGYDISNKFKFFYSRKTDYKLAKKGYSKTNQISNIYPIANPYETTSDSIIWVLEQEGTRIRCRDESIELDSEKINQWFLENNVEILYEYDEPIIQDLPNSVVLQGFDDATVYIENDLTPTVTYGYNALIPYKEEIKTQKEEVEFNTSDIEENIIPYLMDVEFNLMMMEDM